MHSGVQSRGRNRQQDSIQQEVGRKFPGNDERDEVQRWLAAGWPFLPGVRGAKLEDAGVQHLIYRYSGGLRHRDGVLSTAGYTALQQLRDVSVLSEAG